jgi:3-methyladenine DNA glycosylase AlkC
MAEGALTGYFGDELLERIARQFEAANRDFPRRAFLVAAGDLRGLGLMARVERIGRALGAALPGDPQAAWEMMSAALPPPLGPNGKTFNDGYWMLPLAAYWPLVHGDRPEVGVTALAELTKRGTSEFALRPFVERYPDWFIPTLQRWVGDPSFHVRRLASEGTRPKLPWKGKLRVARETSLRYFEIIRHLADDTSSYVRRSVGNHARDLRALDEAAVERWLDRAKPPADVRKRAAPRR